MSVVEKLDSLDSSLRRFYHGIIKESEQSDLEEPGGDSPLVVQRFPTARPGPVLDEMRENDHSPIAINDTVDEQQSPGQHTASEQDSPREEELDKESVVADLSSLLPQDCSHAAATVCPEMSHPPEAADMVGGTVTPDMISQQPIVQNDDTENIPVAKQEHIGSLDLSLVESAENEQNNMTERLLAANLELQEKLENMETKLVLEQYYSSQLEEKVKELEARLNQQTAADSILSAVNDDVLVLDKKEGTNKKTNSLRSKGTSSLRATSSAKKDETKLRRQKKEVKNKRRHSLVDLCKIIDDEERGFFASASSDDSSLDLGGSNHESTKGKSKSQRTKKGRTEKKKRSLSVGDLQANLTREKRSVFEEDGFYNASLDFLVASDDKDVSSLKRQKNKRRSLECGMSHSLHGETTPARLIPNEPLSQSCHNSSTKTEKVKEKRRQSKLVRNGIPDDLYGDFDVPMPGDDSLEDRNSPRVRRKSQSSGSLEKLGSRRKNIKALEVKKSDSFRLWSLEPENKPRRRGSKKDLQRISSDGDLKDHKKKKTTERKKKPKSKEKLKRSNSVGTIEDGPCESLKSLINELWNDDHTLDTSEMSPPAKSTQSCGDLHCDKSGFELGKKSPKSHKSSLLAMLSSNTRPYISKKRMEASHPTQNAQW